MRASKTKRDVALFIGRFQPFHRGHLTVAKRLSNKHKKLVIAIGSAQYARTPENPFPTEERKRMISSALKEAGIRNWSLVAIPDIGDHSKWVSWVESRTAPFDIVYTGNAFVASLFRKAGYPIHVVKEIGGISATRIRKLMMRGKAWTRLVPPAVRKIIKKKRLDKRFRSLMIKNERKNDW